MSNVGYKDTDEVLARIRSALGDRLLDLRQPFEKRVYLEVDSRDIVDTARVLSVTLQARLQTASAVDAPRKIEILYHWSFDPIGLVVTVRTRIDRDQPGIASITTTCPAAHWIEREMWELMGISFQGHPDMRHLLLQDDWPAGKFPLRRDYRRE
jgi:Ni,Fe-hydrogenase III component G